MRTSIMIRNDCFNFDLIEIIGLLQVDKSNCSRVLKGVYYFSIIDNRLDCSNLINFDHCNCVI